MSAQAIDFPTDPQRTSRERSETMERAHSADATPRVHRVAVDRDAQVHHIAVAGLAPSEDSGPGEARAGFVSQNTQGASSHHGSTAPNSEASPQSPNPGDSDSRTERNRQNSQHSTGPRTAEGKTASSRNSFKHGLSIHHHTVLRHEDPADYEQLRAELREIFAPQSPREHLALDDIAQSRWALRRFDEGEATLLEYHFADGASPALSEEDHVSYGEALGYTCIQEPGEPPTPEYPSLLLLQRYRGHWDRRYQRALAGFDRARQDRRREAREQLQQAEAARKAEREASAERRREEAHQLRIALAQERLLREQQRAAKVRQESEEEAVAKLLEDYLQAPSPSLTSDQPATPGFVSSAQCVPDADAELAGETPASQSA